MESNKEILKHIIITRLMYRDKELLKIRTKLLKDILIPCLESQTNQNFTFCIMMHSEDISFVKDIINYDFITFNNYDNLRQYVIKENFQIQTRHDSDDYMSEIYVDTIQNKCKSISNTEDISLIQFQPDKINYQTKEKMYMPLYDNTIISGFVTLYQKEVKLIIYEKSHTTLFELTSNIHTFPSGYVIYYIHGNNDSLIPRDERIKKWEFNNSIKK